MYKKPKKKNSLSIIIIGIILFILLSISLLLPKSGNNYLLKDISILINKAAMYPFTIINE